MMKTLLKMLAGFLTGIAGGLLIAVIGIVIFTDTTLSEFVARLQSGKAIEMITAALVGIISFLLSLVILIPAHEAGHLICGLLTGYKFVSFRIFNLTFIKIDGKLRVKHFSIAGTGGQCLLVPPDVPYDKIPTVWYNAGGVLANLFLLLIVLPLLWLDLNPFLFEGLLIFCLIDGLIIITNGVPMKVGGVSNDAYNMLHLRHNPQSKRALAIQLRSNKLIQEGVRPKDMPAEFFECTTDIDYKNPLEVTIPLMHASRLVDEMEWENAYGAFEELYGHRAEILPIYVNEIACELAFCAMVTGRLERAKDLLDPKLRKYITAYSKVMSSKQRFLFAISKYLDNDLSKAREIYNSLENTRDNYLLQGEVKSDLALMRHLMDRWEA